jgi:hypothetical protein
MGPPMMVVAVVLCLAVAGLFRNALDGVLAGVLALLAADLRGGSR